MLDGGCILLNSSQVGDGRDSPWVQFCRKHSDILRYFDAVQHWGILPPKDKEYWALNGYTLYSTYLRILICINFFLCLSFVMWLVLKMKQNSLPRQLLQDFTVIIPFFPSAFMILYLLFQLSIILLGVCLMFLVGWSFNCVRLMISLASHNEDPDGITATIFGS